MVKKKMLQNKITSINIEQKHYDKAKERIEEGEFTGISDYVRQSIAVHEEQLVLKNPYKITNQG